MALFFIALSRGSRPKDVIPGFIVDFQASFRLALSVTKNVNNYKDHVLKSNKRISNFKLWPAYKPNTVLMFLVKVKYYDHYES